MIQRYYTTDAEPTAKRPPSKLFNAELKDWRTGEIIFQQDNVEFPEDVSQTSVNIVAQKYFRGPMGTPERESSYFDMVDRIVHWYGDQFAAQKYGTMNEASIFMEELRHILYHRIAAFNSPVWFNVGVEEEPQVAACFINSVEDTMESILDLVKTKGTLFKYGSGSGTNYSKVRGAGEHLSGGGIASGVMSFRKMYDATGGVIKSGGKSRRAAMMDILDIDHPDIEEFIACKSKQEKVVRALIDAGWSDAMDGEDAAYDNAWYQNSNQSVRVPDDFMIAVKNNTPWQTIGRVDSGVDKQVNAVELFRSIAQAAWETGDPGLQYDTAINEWHTCAESGRINASNPCSEFMFLDETSCNLASINLTHFLDEDGSFDLDEFGHVIDTLILAMDISVDAAFYPTQEIRKATTQYRPLGLGFANLGQLLMELGLPYDSRSGRWVAGHLSSFMTATAYNMSTQIASTKGAFAEYFKNRKSMEEVLIQHRTKNAFVPLKLDNDNFPLPDAFPSEQLSQQTAKLWNDVIKRAKQHGMRNAQATVLAPTGTISFLMDCDTTGIEPEIGLIRYKNLAGGGQITMTNNAIDNVLERLGYTHTQVGDILDHLTEKGTLKDAPHLDPAYYPIFATSFGDSQGNWNVLRPEAHLLMMAACQPFISGAISKTVNLPEDATVEDVENIYWKAWELKLKAVAVYRNNCKATQAIITKQEDSENEEEPEKVKVIFDLAKCPEHRLKPPVQRDAITRKFEINGLEFYVHVGMYENGAPCEIFIDVSKEGSFVKALASALAIQTSIGLQHGAPLKTIVDKWRGTKFEPQGFTGNPEYPSCTSMLDLIAQWLDTQFIQKYSEDDAESVLLKTAEPAQIQVSGNGTNGTNGTQPKKLNISAAFENGDFITCTQCGGEAFRNGTCYLCSQCGATTGCS